MKSISELADQINMSAVLESACNGALESIQEQLERLDIPDDLKDEVEDEVFTNRISIR